MDQTALFQWSPSENVCTIQLWFCSNFLKLTINETEILWLELNSRCQRLNHQLLLYQPFSYKPKTWASSLKAASCVSLIIISPHLHLHLYALNRPPPFPHGPHFGSSDCQTFSWPFMSSLVSHRNLFINCSLFCLQLLVSWAELCFSIMMSVSWKTHRHISTELEIRPIDNHKHTV